MKFGVALGLVFFVVPVSAQALDCNHPTAQAVSYFQVSDHPFSAIPSADGCTIFVSLLSDTDASHLLVLTRRGGQLSLLREFAANGHLGGMALSHDGQLLAAANGAGATLFDTARLISGKGNPVIDYLDDGPESGSIYVAIAPDDHILFVSDERSQSLSVYDLAAIRAGHGATMIGRVPTGEAPVGLAFSPDGRFLYSTSEAMRGGSPSCPSEDGRRSHPAGELMIVDVSRAASKPADGVMVTTRAGCNPVRVVLSAKGDLAYVSARGSNMLEVFSTKSLLSNGEHPLLSEVSVGRSPVGVAIAQGKVFVTNSDRFGSSLVQSVSVIDANNLSFPQRTIPAGGFPRELSLTADGGVLLITNFKTNSLELVDLARLTELQK